MVLHIHDGKIKTHPLTDLLCKTASSVNQVLTDDRAVIRRDFPFTVFQKPGPGHAGVPMNRCAALARTCSHGIGRTRGIGMTVIGCVETHLDVVDHQQGVQFKNLCRTDQMTFTAHRIQNSLYIMEPVHFLICQREANRAAAVPAGRLTRLRLERSVQGGCLLMQLCHTQTPDEMGNEARCMPGRSGGKFPFFDQDNIVPAFFGQEIQQPGAERTAANDHHSCMLVHFLTPSLLILIRFLCSINGLIDSDAT